ncbi:hypothetical protein GCM10010174_20630 [Kutzneria viridogrisea]|uniref:Transglycosylase SLT domain-containing protein n=1 Tax=Kutzneria viridogrisea TaxID=47990 RepID=A0ABR6B8V4_9PSEU|nr:hypothetical protein [Kutzneria viridogrisea]
MTRLLLTDQQIAQHAYDAGFRGDALTTAVAVAIAESHNNAHAVGDVSLETAKWGPSVGLWQIRSLNPGHGTAAERVLRDEQANADPATNARHAYALSNHGRNFRPWSTYTGGDYRRYLNRARTAGGQVGGTPAGGAATPSTGFQAHPPSLERAATDLAAQADVIRSVHGAVGTPSPAASAFGGLPESRQAAEAHTRTVAAIAERVEQQAQRAAVLSGGLRDSAANYRHGDSTAATAYRSLLD